MMIYSKGIKIWLMKGVSILELWNFMTVKKEFTDEL